jgi:ABC-type multidrug transport system ATPase subunit
MASDAREDVVIAARRLAKTFGRRRAVDDVSFEVRPGELLALVGRDGAGKSTTMRMLVGLLEPTTGEAELLGRPVGPDAYRVFERVGFASQEPGFRRGLTVRHSLDLHRRLLGVTDEGAVDRVLAAVGAQSVADDRVGDITDDERRLVGVARSLLHDPEVLILDEPLRGLGRAMAATISDLVERLVLERGTAIVMTAHASEGALGPASHVGVMHDGRIVGLFGKKELRERGRHHLEIVVSDTARASVVLEHELGVADFAVCQGGLVRVYVPGERAAQVNAALQDAGVGISHLSVNQESLSDLIERLASEGERR